MRRRRRRVRRSYGTHRPFKRTRFVRIRIPRRIAYKLPRVVDVPPVVLRLRRSRHRRVPLRHGTSYVYRTIGLRGPLPSNIGESYVGVDRRQRLVQYSRRRTRRYLHGRRRHETRPLNFRSPQGEFNRFRRDEEERKVLDRRTSAGQAASLESDRFGIVGGNASRGSIYLDDAAAVSRALDQKVR